MAKESNEPGEREKSERNLDYLQVSYRADMIAIVLVIATVFEPSAIKNTQWRQSANFVARCLFLRLLNLTGH
jgi:hypothetical protein